MIINGYQTKENPIKKTMILAAVLAFTALPAAYAAEGGEYVLTLKDHLFSPTELTVPAGQKVKITVKNEDTTPAEFESHDLKREKIIAGNSEAVISVGPLKPGTYKFFDEFNEKTAQGLIKVE